MQATIAVFDSEHADSFGEFCKRNSAPCSLLYVSKLGEVTAPPLAEDSDVRTDLSRYRVWRRDKEVKEINSLVEYPWQNKVTFYIGCSFAFEKALQDVGVPLRNVEQQCNVSMYRTNISCKPVGPFHTNMVVCMRPVPQNLLKETFEATQDFVGAHGAPIHIGDPEVIGIGNLHTPDWGGTLKFHEGEVPVFWACGVTVLEAIASSGVDLAFTHALGSMFICDVSVDYCGMSVSSSPVAIVNVSSPAQEFSASVVSMPIARKIRDLQNCLFSTTCIDDELLVAACCLSHSNLVVVVLHCCLNGDELKGFGVFLRALVCLPGKTKVYIDETKSDMHADLEQLLQYCGVDDEVTLVTDLETLSTIQFDSLIVVGNPTRQLLECWKPVILAKCHIIAIGPSYLTGLRSVRISGNCVVALVVLALSICLLQSCPIHVRYLARGICEEPVKGRAVTDQIISEMQGPQCFESLLAMAVEVVV